MTLSVLPSIHSNAHDCFIYSIFQQKQIMNNKKTINQTWVNTSCVLIPILKLILILRLTNERVVGGLLKCTVVWLILSYHFSAAIFLFTWSYRFNFCALLLSYHLSSLSSFHIFFLFEWRWTGSPLWISPFLTSLYVCTFSHTFPPFIFHHLITYWTTLRWP